MYYHEKTNTYVREGAGFELDGIQYPANWLNLATEDDKLIHGLVEVVTVGTRADERTHFVTEELVGGELRIINTPKPAEMLEAMDTAALEQALVKVKAVREQVLDRLMGIAGRAQRRGDTALATACDTAAEALLDLTANLPAGMAAASEEIGNRYKAIAIAAITAAPDLESAFARIDA